jgi:hypothetical protein
LAQDARRQPDFGVVARLMLGPGAWRMLRLVLVLMPVLVLVLILVLILVVMLVLVLMVRLRLLLRLLLSAIPAAISLRLIAVIWAIIVAALALVLVRILSRTTLLAVLFEPGVQHTIIMIGVLEVIFGQDPVAGERRVAGKRQILLHQLLGIAPRPIVVIAAVEIWIAAWGTRFTTTAAAAVTSALTSLHVILLAVHSMVKDRGKAPISETSALNGWRGKRPRQHGFFWGWHAGGKSTASSANFLASNTEAMSLWTMEFRSPWLNLVSLAALSKLFCDLGT